MIGLDTNILVRYFAQDDPIQSPQATEIIERRLTAENCGFVSIVAMVETVWVLDRAYGLADHEIANAIERALQSDILVVESEQEVFTAMIALKEGRGSFADALIACSARGLAASERSHLITRHSGCLGSSFHKSPTVGFSISTHHRWMRISSIHSRLLRLTRCPLPQVKGRSTVRVHPILKPVLICCPRPKDGRRSVQC
jgi:predicted nucleic-acid-binding protein